MKSKILCLLLITSCLALSQTDERKFEPYTGLWRSGNITESNDNLFIWQPVQTPINSQILDVFFIDTLRGWVAHNGNGAMRTTDGGFNWITISFNDTNFTTGYNGVHFVNANTGWCVGGALQIRKTTNGGLNWFKQNSAPAAGILHSIYFFDENNGIGVGSKNYPYVPYVEKTSNGGTNWTEMNISFPGAQELNQQYWLDQNTGWVAGYDVLLITSNGGASFSNRFSNVPPTGNGHNALLCIWFVNQQTGWLGGSNLERNNLYKTTNGGMNWVFQPNPAAQNTYAQINDVRMLNADSGWAIHGTPFSGAIMFTSNGGANWITEEGSNNWFDCIYFIPNQKAWVGASSGRVWYSILRQVPTGISGNENVPNEFQIYQNYPNPFNPSTKIKFDVGSFPLIKGVRGMDVSLSVYNIIGQQISTLVNQNLKPGTYEVEWDATNYPSGVYYYKLSADGYTETKKMLLIR